MAAQLNNDNGGGNKRCVSLGPFLCIAVCAHLFLALHNYCGVDGANFFSYYSQYAFGLSGGRCNYFSASFSALAVPHVISCLLRVPLVACAKFLQSVFWIWCSYLVVTMLPKHARGGRVRWFLFLALNPVAIFNIHYHVQYDALALFLMVAGLDCYRRKGAAARLLAGLCWALAVSVKTYPALLLPLFLFDRREPVRGKALFYCSLLLFFLIPEIPWICRVGWSQTFLPALGYQGFHRFGLYLLTGASGEGWAGKASALTDSAMPALAAVVLILVGTLIRRGRASLFQGIGLFLALLLLVSTRNAPQYFIFVIPFLILFRSRGALVFANAAYAVILAFFYLLDKEMSGSYCLLNCLHAVSIGGGALAFWGRLSPWISRYVWGCAFIIASGVFSWAYWPARGEVKDDPVPAASRGKKSTAPLWIVLSALWGLSLLSAHFRGNPFSMPPNGLPDILNCNTVLEPASTLAWYGSRGEYELRFTGLSPGDAVLVSGDSYFRVRIGDRTIGPFRGDGNKLYSFWWGISYSLSYDDLEKNNFLVGVTNQLCSIRGENTVMARLGGNGRDWIPNGHGLEGKVQVMRCALNGVPCDVTQGERLGWQDTGWLTLSPSIVPAGGHSAVNIFTILLAYLVVFFSIVTPRLDVS
ncbi:MAG: glycosyltransferase 87 family protein [Candidatus Aureabacteria bacterium]|nr:glycosyltransferase 87 family protein [Candidatus Auribacterota bacterium]